MLKITRDGEKTIDNERLFNKSLLPRWKQKWLIFKLGLVIVSDTYNVSKGQYDAFFKLRKKVLTRLDQIDSNIIDTTLEERLKIAEWFAQEKDLVGIKKDKNSSIEYTLFYSNNGSLSEIIKLKYSIPITIEIDKQMIDGYIYSISDLLTYNAPCKVEK
jgi:hypothetical protein